jgi:hypothetical protein
MADIKDNVKTVSYGELIFGIRITLSVNNIIYHFVPVVLYELGTDTC